MIRNLKQWNSSPTLHFFSHLKEVSARQWRQRPAAHRSQQSVETQEKDVARLRKMGNASTRNAYSPSQQKVSSHSHGISKIEGLIVSTTPEPKVKQKRSREPDCHKKEEWVAIRTFDPSEKSTNSMQHPVYTYTCTYKNTFAYTYTNTFSYTFAYLYIYKICVYIYTCRHGHNNIRKGIVWAQTDHNTWTFTAALCVIEL